MRGPYHRNRNAPLTPPGLGGAEKTRSPCVALGIGTDVYYNTKSILRPERNILV